MTKPFNIPGQGLPTDTSWASPEPTQENLPHLRRWMVRDLELFLSAGLRGLGQGSVDREQRGGISPENPPVSSSRHPLVPLSPCPPVSSLLPVYSAPTNTEVRPC